MAPELLGGRGGVSDAVLVALGGAAGGPARYAVESVLPHAQDGLPWGTLGVNVAGAFALGMVVSARGWGRPRLQVVLGTGFLGAFTTFSTWVLQVVGLAQQGHVIAAVGYLTGTLVAGVAAAAVGVRVGRERPDPRVGPRGGRA